MITAFPHNITESQLCYSASSPSLAVPIGHKLMDITVRHRCIGDRQPKFDHLRVIHMNYSYKVQYSCYSKQGRI